MFKEKDANRFWSKVKKTKTCWEWIAYRNRLGYGVLNIRGKSTLAHRFVWFLTHGPFPREALICHHCDNPSCVNPNHLYQGTPRSNVQDCLSRGRHVAPKGEKHWTKQFGKRIARGNSSPVARLTEAQVLAIRARYALGWKNKTRLGKEYKIDNSVITDILNREIWTHI